MTPHTQNNYTPPQAESTLGQGLAAFERSLFNPSPPLMPAYEPPAVHLPKHDPPDGLEELVGAGAALSLRRTFPSYNQTRLLVVGALMRTGRARAIVVHRYLNDRGFAIGQTNVWHHLAAMADAGVVEVSHTEEGGVKLCKHYELKTQLK